MNYNAKLAAEVNNIQTILLGTQTVYSNNSTRKFSIMVTGDVTPSWVTGKVLPNATGGAVYNESLIASSPYPLTYQVSSGNLPLGISLNSTTAVLSGTAPAVNTTTTYSFTVIADDGIQQISKIFNLPVISSNAPVWQTPAGMLPTIIGGKAFSFTLQAISSLALTYAIQTGGLPPGLSLNASSGIISGTATNPTQTQTYNFTVSASDGTNVSNISFSIQVVVNLPPAWVTPAGVLPSALGGVPYSQTVVAQSAISPVYAIRVGELPPGLSLISSTGEIKGTPANPTANVYYDFTVGANNTATTADRNFAINLLVNYPPVWVTPAGPLTSDFFLAANSSFQFAANDVNSQNLSFTLDPATPLPAGLSLSSTGLLSGTPTGPTGQFKFNVLLSDGLAVNSRSFSSTILPSETGIHVIPDEVTANIGANYVASVTLNQSILDTVSYDATTNTAIVTSILDRSQTYTYTSTEFAVTVNTD